MSDKFVRLGDIEGRQQINQHNKTYHVTELAIPIGNASYVSKDLPDGVEDSARIRLNSDTGIAEIEDVVAGAFKPLAPLASVVAFTVGSGGNIPGTTTPVPANGATSVSIPALAGITGGIMRYNSHDIINNVGITFAPGGGFSPPTPFQIGETWFWQFNAAANIEPPVLNDYTLNGGSTKTMQDIDLELNQTSFHEDAYQYGVTVATPTISTTPNYCFSQNGYTVPANSFIDTIHVNADGTGTIYALVLRLSGSNYIEVSRTNLAVTTGNNTFSVDIPVLAGDKLGIGNSGSITARYTNGGVKYSVANITSGPASFAASLLDGNTGTGNGIMGFNFHIAAVDISAGIVEQLSDKANQTDLDALSDLALKDSDLTMSIGTNKFDKSTMVLLNTLVDNTGALITISGAKAAETPVEPGDYSFQLSKYIGTQGGQIRLVDSSRNLVSTFDGTTLSADGTNTGKKITIPSNVRFMQNNLFYEPTSYADITDTFQLQEGDTITGYEPYIKLISAIKGTGLLAEGGSTSDIPHYDINVVAMGDSITWLAPPKSYISHVLERMSFNTFNNLALSGATWSHTSLTAYDITQSGGAISDDNVIWNQFNVLVSRVAANTIPIPDLIFIPAGTNDMTRTVGSVSTTFGVGTSIIGNAPNTILSVTDAVRYVCELILQQWPLVQIILFTPLQRGISDNSTMRNIGDAIEGCANMLSVVSVRQDKLSGIYGYNEISQDIFLYDNLHPNEAGALKIGKFFARSLMNSIQI